MYGAALGGESLWLSDIIAWNAKTGGFYIQHASDSFFRNITAGNTTGQPFMSSHVFDLAISNMVMVDCRAYRGYYGFHIHDKNMIALIRCYPHLNYRSGIYVWNSNYVKIIACDTYENNQGAFGHGDEIALGSGVGTGLGRYCHVIGCRIEGGNYGICEYNDADYNTIANNTFLNQAVAPVSLVGANTTCRRNIGYKTESSGVATFSGDGVTTSFSWAHGLVSTPNVILVTPKSADAAITHSASADAANITIEFTSAPAAGTNNVVLAWYAEV